MKLHLILSVAAAAGAHAAHSACTADGDLLVSTKQGPVRGTQVHDGVNAFLGIPFAEPPLGPLRFQPPQPLRYTHRQPLNATSFGPSCYQFRYRGIFTDSISPRVPESEDCLTLNVYVPKRPKGERKKLPVYVWSYGGGFGEGSPTAAWYDPINFVAENKDIIVVNWNYRLNIFGFPNTPALKAQNLGIRDQRFALEWLRDNIASFGGDPKRMVLGGESAGAISSHSMVYAHPKDPIVSALILQSGTSENHFPKREGRDEEFVRIAKVVGCASRDRKQELKCMQAVDANKLKLATSNKTLNEFGEPNGGMPMADDVVMFTNDDAKRRGEAGNFARLPTLMGTNLNEGDSAVPDWDPVKGSSRDTSDAITETIFECNMALEARIRAQHNVPVWRYSFRGIFSEITPYPWVRAYHGADLSILWGTFNFLKTAETNSTTQEASKFMQQMFGAFIRDPARGLADKYSMPKFRPDSKSVIELFNDNKPAFSLGIEPNLTRCWYMAKTPSEKTT